MKLLERSIKGVLKRPIKSIAFLLIVVLILNFMMGSFMILNSTTRIESFLKSKLGPVIGINSIFEREEGQLTSQSMDIYNKIYDEISTVADEISRINGVINLDYTSSAELLYFDTEDLFDGSQCRFVSKIELCHNVGFSGVHSTEFNELANKKIQLTNGRTFSEEEMDNGSLVMLISENSAIKNKNGESIKVGDTISYKSLYDHPYDSDYQMNPDSMEVYEVKVIGTFEENPIFDILGLNYNSTDYSNHIIFPDKFLQKIRSTLEEVATEDNSSINPLGSIGMMKLFNFRIYVENVDMEPEVLSEIKSIVARLGSEGSEIEVFTSQQSYNKVLGPIIALKTIGQNLLVGVFIASVVMLILLNMYFLVDRQSEIGIYMALGESRFRIVSQILIEVVLIVGLAFLTTIPTTKTLENAIGNFVVSGTGNQIIESLSNPTVEGNLDDTIDIAIGRNDFLNVNVLVFLTVISSNLLSSIYILRLKPKNVLQK